MMLFTTLNYLAILVSAIVYFLIGFLWYSPMLFADRWAKETGVSMGKGQKLPVMPMIGEFIGTLLFTLGIAVFLKGMTTTGILTGIVTGIMTIVLFVFPLNSGTWFFKGKRVLFLIEWGYQSIGALVIGIILSLWR
jgi:hypothetical protein